MNRLLDTGAVTILLTAAGLALIAALVIVWRSNGLVDPDESTCADAVADGGKPAALTDLQDHLAREFLSAVRAAVKIPPNSLAAGYTPHLADRITAAAHSVTRQLHTLGAEGKDKWLTSACIGQAQLVGVSAIQVETAALAAVRSPADRRIAAHLSRALVELDEAVDNLQALVRSSAEG